MTLDYFKAWRRLFWFLVIALILSTIFALRAVYSAGRAYQVEGCCSSQMCVQQGHHPAPMAMQKPQCGSIKTIRSQGGVWGQPRVTSVICEDFGQAPHWIEANK